MPQIFFTALNSHSKALGLQNNLVLHRNLLLPSSFTIEDQAILGLLRRYSYYSLCNQFFPLYSFLLHEKLAIISTPNMTFKFTQLKKIWILVSNSATEICFVSETPVLKFTTASLLALWTILSFADSSACTLKFRCFWSISVSNDCIFRICASLSLKNLKWLKKKHNNHGSS